jgi:hypothetical protein
LTYEFYEGHRVRHIRDGLVGTVAGIEEPQGATTSVPTYQVKWDNGSFERRVDPSEIAAAPSAREA